MGICNYCSLKNKKKDAKKEGKTITVLYSGDVYKHPKEVDIKKLNYKDREQYWISWMMEIPDGCVC